MERAKIMTGFKNIRMELKPLKVKMNCGHIIDALADFGNYYKLVIGKY